MPTYELVSQAMIEWKTESMTIKACMDNLAFIAGYMDSLLNMDKEKIYP